MFHASSKEVIPVEKSLLTRKSNDLEFLNVWALTIIIRTCFELNNRLAFELWTAHVSYYTIKTLSGRMFENKHQFYL